MEPQDGNQYNIPGQTDAKRPDPHLPSEEEKKHITEGAKNEDQLDKFKDSANKTSENKNESSDAEQS